MKLISKGKYKSLNDFEWDNIPMFTVLTGKNGTGKTQLLDLLNYSITGTRQVDYIPESKIQIEKEFFRVEDLVYLRDKWQLSNLDSVNLNSIQSEREGLYTEYLNHIQRYKDTRNLKNLTQAGVRIIHNDYTHKQIFFDKIFSNDLILNFNPDREEFLRLLPDNFVIDLKNQISNINIGKTFFTYHLNYKEAKANGATDEDFYSKNPQKPWVTINNIFKDIDLPYELNSPEEISLKDFYRPRLKNSTTKEFILFTDLSSGEQVLVSLVFWLFNSKEFNVFPRLLLLDEPDAHLHPSMTKQFIGIIKNVLSDKYNVRVIMTTHSPSTVALTPEESLFVINKNGQKIEKTTKDRALKILTAGVPSFSVNYENRRQVFVESPYDVLYYEKIYQKLSNYLIPEVSLSFISSGDSRTDKNGNKISNCEQVSKITMQLRETGNNFIWGIIDWDKINTSTDFIKLLGDGNRYSIENYLFDPLLISALLLRQKIILREDLSLTRDKNYTDFKNLSQEQLQIISDFLIKKISSKINPQETVQSPIRLINGKEINVPTWYLCYNGHLLEEVILSTFPELNSIKKGKEETLKLEIIDKIIDDIPELISVDLLNIFKSVQTVE